MTGQRKAWEGVVRARNGAKAPRRAVGRPKPCPVPSSAPKARKYRNQPTNGYASKKEAQRAAELRLMEKAGLICELREQVRYVLIPAQRIDGNLVERECAYMADFTYFEMIQDGQEFHWSTMIVVEDVKGKRTEGYIIKRKLMLEVHGIRIREV